MNMREKIARALCGHDHPCSSMVHEIMNPEDPMYERANAARSKATGQTEREWYLQKADIVLEAMSEPTEKMVSLASCAIRSFKPADKMHPEAYAKFIISAAISGAKEGK